MLGFMLDTNSGLWMKVLRVSLQSEVAEQDEAGILTSATILFYPVCKTKYEFASQFQWILWHQKD